MESANVEMAAVGTETMECGGRKLNVADRPVSLGSVTLQLKRTMHGKPCLVLIQRGRKSGKRLRTVWETEHWIAIKAAIPQIQALFKSPHKESVHLTVNENCTITFTLYDQNSLLVKVVTEDSFYCTVKTRRTRLSITDWDCLVDMQEDVNRAFSIDQRAREQLNPRGIKRKRGAFTQVPIQERELTLRYYVWSTAGDKSKGVEEREEYYMLTPECYEEAEAFENEHNVEVSIESHRFKVYNDMQMMKYVFAWLLCQKVKEIAEQECVGCENDCPDQRSHMEGGCLMDFKGQISEYCESASDAVTASEMVSLYSEFLKLINAKSTTVLYAIAQCVKAFTCGDMEIELETYVA